MREASPSALGLVDLCLFVQAVNGFAEYTGEMFSMSVPSPTLIVVSILGWLSLYGIKAVTHYKSRLAIQWA